MSRKVSGGMKYVANCSFGKDSLAMVLLLMEKGYPLDEVIFYDTEMEFQSIYHNCSRLEQILTETNIKFTILKDLLPFRFRAFEKEIHSKNGTTKYGYDWCGGIRRWGTSGKLSAISKHYKENYGDEVIVEYVGIAADERNRVEKYRRKRNKTIKLYPLVEWGMTEQDCLEYCYHHGWNWQENGHNLYEILDRVSCWCCANKNQREIRNIITYLPDYWEKIKEYEQKCNVPYKGKSCGYFEEKWRKG